MNVEQKIWTNCVWIKRFHSISLANVVVFIRRPTFFPRWLDTICYFPYAIMPKLHSRFPNSSHLVFQIASSTYIHKVNYYIWNTHRRNKQNIWFTWNSLHPHIQTVRLFMWLFCIPIRFITSTITTRIYTDTIICTSISPVPEHLSLMLRCECTAKKNTKKKTCSIYGEVGEPRINSNPLNSNLNNRINMWCT